VDTAKEYDKGEAYGEHWFKAASLSRVTVEDVNGGDFDPETLYAVITSNANFNGMDASYAFKAAAEEHEKSTITTAVVRDVVWMYLSEELGNVIGETYAEPQGRITIAE
jgi:5'-nucleotidase